MAQPAAPNAGIASRLTIEDHWPGVGELERSVKSEVSLRSSASLASSALISKPDLEPGSSDLGSLGSGIEPMFSFNAKDAESAEDRRGPLGFGLWFRRFPCPPQIAGQRYKITAAE